MPKGVTRVEQERHTVMIERWVSRPRQCPRTCGDASCRDIDRNTSRLPNGERSMLSLTADPYTSSYERVFNGFECIFSHARCLLIGLSVVAFWGVPPRNQVGFRML